MGHALLAPSHKPFCCRGRRPAEPTSLRRRIAASPAARLGSACLRKPVEWRVDVLSAKMAVPDKTRYMRSRCSFCARDEGRALGCGRPAHAFSQRSTNTSTPAAAAPRRDELAKRKMAAEQEQDAQNAPAAPDAASRAGRSRRGRAARTRARRRPRATPDRRRDARDGLPEAQAPTQDGPRREGLQI